MLLRSTRAGAPPVGFSAAMERGLAPDGGLYVPEQLPQIDSDDPVRLLEPFFAGDPLAPELPDICSEAGSFPLPLALRGRHAVLELFHGPTAAFKDVGAQFLAQCVRRRGGERSILVATSGDTGSAVAAAFHEMPGVRVGILFPRDGVSARQRHQLTCWGGNVTAFSVSGTFDDCQRILKEALSDRTFTAAHNLTTANSVNIARLLPQVGYYATASLTFRQQRDATPDVVIPSGNLGKATACVWAKRMGLPIGRVVLATNANRTISDYFATGRWEPRAARRTLANAMDVGDPSNMERILDLYPNSAALRDDVTAVSVTDAEIERTIREEFAEGGNLFDPHTATAVRAAHDLGLTNCIVVATAHPAKFDAIVEPLIGQAVAVPPALATLLARPTESLDIEANLDELARAWR